MCAGLAICNFTYRYLQNYSQKNNWMNNSVLVYLIWILVFLELQCIWGGKGSSGRMCSCTWTQEEGTLADGESLLVTAVAASKYELKNRVIESLQYFSFFQLLLCEEERTVQKVKWTKTKNKTLLCSFRVSTNRWSWLLHLAQLETLPRPLSKITLTQLLLTLSLGLSKSKAARPWPAACNGFSGSTCLCPSQSLFQSLLKVSQQCKRWGFLMFLIKSFTFFRCCRSVSEFTVFIRQESPIASPSPPYSFYKQVGSFRECPFPCIDL